jgi:hypothetical protein
MRDPAASLRYLGFQALTNGGRRLNFSFTRPDKAQQTISVEASNDLFSGPDHMAIQECAGICYETLKRLVADWVDTFPASIRLTLADVTQHRKPGKTSARGWQRRTKVNSA